MISKPDKHSPISAQAITPVQLLHMMVYATSLPGFTEEQAEKRADIAVDEYFKYHNSFGRMPITPKEKP